MYGLYIVIRGTSLNQTSSNHLAISPKIVSHIPMRRVIILSVGAVDNAVDNLSRNKASSSL
jgi:hypothetical protein